MPKKQDFPSLLADGFHEGTLEKVQGLCVDALPFSASRVRLMAGLRAMVDLLTTDGIRGNLWIDGSFLTTKLEPNDVDVVLEVSEAMIASATHFQKNRLKWFGSKQPADRNHKLRDYTCDCYVFSDDPGSTRMRHYWKGQFGCDRSNNPKGIFVLQINGGAR